MSHQFNTEKGQFLGEIVGGEFDKEKIFSTWNGKGLNNINTSDLALLIENLYKEFHTSNQLVQSDLDELQTSIMQRKTPLKKKLRVYYDEAIRILEESKNREIILDDDSFFEPSWDKKKERQIWFVTGMSGSGKSHWSSKMCEKYMRIFPDNKVILLSNKPKDPAFDKYLEHSRFSKQFMRLPMNEELLDDPVSLQEIHDSLVIMDDIEASSVKGMTKEMDRIRELILCQGRSTRVSLLYISHLSNNYKQTKTILNECHGIVVFPGMSTKHSLKYLLTTYFGFDKKGVDKLIRVPSRWALIRKCPTIVVHQKGGFYID